MSYAGHTVRGSSEINAVFMLEGKINAAKTGGQPRRNWANDIKVRTDEKDYNTLTEMQTKQELIERLAHPPSIIILYYTIRGSTRKIQVHNKNIQKQRTTK